jgi:hypothetical protein
MPADPLLRTRYAVQREDDRIAATRSYKEVTEWSPEEQVRNQVFGQFS